MLIRIAALALVSGPLLLVQAADDDDVPAITKFVAPAYPWAAKDQRIMGTTQTVIAIDRVGAVTQVKMIAGHPVFADYLLDALKQWRFKPSSRDHTLKITCVFELTIDVKCQPTDKSLSETHVSVDLPAVLHIRTGLCNIFIDP